MEHAKQFTRHISKELVNLMPLASFDGETIIIDRPEQIDEAVGFLRTCPVLGIDTEARPSFTRGTHYPTALVQIATEQRCFLFRLNMMGLPDCLVRLLTDGASQKIGLSLHDDWAQLRRRVPFEPVNYIDLQDYVKQLGVEDMSLLKLYANLFGQKISKHQRLSNWEADVLTDPQKRYAATDAWACLNLYHEINRLLTTRDYQLVVNPEPISQETAI